MTGRSGKFPLIVPGPSFRVLATCYLLYLVSGVSYLSLRIWYLVLSVWYLLLGVWYLVFGTLAEVGSSQ